LRYFWLWNLQNVSLDLWEIASILLILNLLLCSLFQCVLLQFTNMFWLPIFGFLLLLLCEVPVKRLRILLCCFYTEILVLQHISSLCLKVRWLLQLLQPLRSPMRHRNILYILVASCLLLNFGRVSNLLWSLLGHRILLMFFFQIL
jgi:hypothetical protein